MANKIVYTYNFKDLIRVTRDDKGNWNYNYTIADVFEKLNKKRSLKDRYDLSKPIDLWEVGVIMGYKVKELLDYCQESYGDVKDNFIHTNKEV